MSGPSKHLGWAELSCRDAAKTPYPVEWRSTRAVALARVFEDLRAACGNVPLTVLSAYRTPAHNRAIGGARNSQHVEGRALDLKPPAGWTVARFAALIRGEADAWGLGGVGVYRTFVHVDIRPRVADRLVVWSGSGAKDATA